MIVETPIEKILFLDIETVPLVYHFSDMDDTSKELFETKNRFQITNEKDVSQVYNERGSILSEFGKIVCISVGMVHNTQLGKTIRIKSYAHDDEETLLKQFKTLLDDHYSKGENLCGHNSKEFDIPYICRRMLINGIKLPEVLNIAGKKPWDIHHIDTMELWKFGDYKSYTSLALLCHVFKIPTPKNDISGADVARVYYEEQDLERIKIYCEKDVIALIQLYLRMKGEPLIEDANIKIST